MNIFQRIRAAEKLQTPVLDDSPISALQTVSTRQTHVGRWRSLRSRVAGRGLLSTMLTVGSLTLLVKAVAAGKEVVVARQLGIGDTLDAFVVAYTLPALAMGIIAGSFSSALIPTYIQVREREGRQAAQRLLSSVTFWSLSLLLLVSGLLALLLPLVLPLLASGFGPEKLTLTRLLFWALLPIITITGLATTWAAVLNAEGEFALPAATPVITSLIVAFFSVRLPAGGAWSLAAGTVAGACLEAGLLGSRLRRHGISLRPRRGGGNKGAEADLRQVMRQYAPQAAAMLVFSGTTLADQAVAARLGSGSVAALSYGSKIVMLFIGVTAIAVSTSVLPHFSRLAALDDWRSVRRDLKSFSALILAVLIPVAALLAFFSVPLVRLLFERGAFTPRDTHMVGQVQACLALQIPFFTVGMLCFRILCALKLLSRNFWISCGNVTLNFVLDVILARSFGVAGIALSTAAVSVVSAGVYYLAVLHAIPAEPTDPAAAEGMRSCG